MVVCLEVAVDIRPGSPTLGQHVAVVADDENHVALWAPACFARGFATLSDVVDLEYLITGNYNGAAESGIAWNDPAIGIDWPVTEAEVTLADKDRNGLSYQEIINEIDGVDQGEMS